MRILKFNESDEILDISQERLQEIVKSISGFSEVLNDKMDDFQSILSELERFKNNSNKSNDQIDDTVLSLESLKSKVNGVISDLETINKNLLDYKDNGRRFLY